MHTTALIDDVVSRAPVPIDEAYSGSRLELVELAFITERVRKPELRERADVCLSWWNERVLVSLGRGHTP